MIDTLNFGKYIYAKLKDLVEDRVYPLVADNNVTMPFIVYQRSNLTSDITKDGLYEDNVTMTINIAAETYSEALRLAKSARELLEVLSAQYENMDITDATISLATEAYSNNAYVETLQMNFNVTNLE